MHHRIPSRIAALAASAALLLTSAGCVVLRPSSAPDPEKSQTGQVYTEVVALPQDIIDGGVLRIGSQLASPPLNFPADEANTYQGINVDLLDEIGERLAVDIEWKQLPFAGLIPAVQSQQIDAAIDLIGDTEERRQVVDFSNYMNQATSPIVKRGNPHGIESVADLCGLPVAIVRGGIQLELAEEENERCLEQGEQPISINQFGAPGDARLSVQAGRTAAFLGNTPVMRYIAEHPSTRDVFEMGGQATYQVQPIGIITAKSRSDIKESIQSTLDVLRADGTIDELLAKWGVEDLALEQNAGGGEE